MWETMASPFAKARHFISSTKTGIYAIEKSLSTWHVLDDFARFEVLSYMCAREPPEAPLPKWAPLRSKAQ